MNSADDAGTCFITLELSYIIFFTVKLETQESTSEEMRETVANSNQLDQL